MNKINDTPRAILEEHRTSTNLPPEINILNEPFQMKTFKNKFRIVVVRYKDDSMEFDLINAHPFLANAFRRLVLSHVPSMAIEKVHIFNNTSIIQDDVLAHRLGLIPLRADPRIFDFRSEDSDASENDTLEFELKIKCTLNDSKKDSSRADDIYKNNNVYSKHIKWSPVGNQAELYNEKDIGPIHDDILIAKMRPGHELDLKLIAVKGIGADHAKFSPVATCWYRLLPEVFLTREVEGEAAERLEHCFTKGVINLQKTEDGRKIAVVNSARYETGSRNFYRHDDLKDAVVVTRKQDHFIFTLDSVGALKPDDIFKEAVKILRDKCVNLLDELYNFQ